MNTTSPRFAICDVPSAIAPIAPRPRGKPAFVKGCPLPIYKTHWTSPKTRRSYVTHEIRWRDASGLRREKHASLEVAKSRVQQIWINVCNGKTIQNNWTESDRAEYLYLRREAATLGIPLIRVLSDFKAGHEISRGRFTYAQSAAFYDEHQPKGVTPKHIPALVQDLLEEKRRLGKGEKWLATISQQLSRFSAKFNCPLHVLQAHEITTWLDGLKVGLRTRKNYRDSVRELVRYAQAKSQLSRTWDELSHVEDAGLPPVEVEIYTPDQIRRYLNARQRIEDRGRSGGTLIPFLVLAVFAGIRHEEMVQRGGTKTVLDWSCIDLDQGFIRIRAIVGKTKRLRIIQMHPNLIEWLRPYTRKSGPICELSQTAGALDRAKKLAGLPSRRGQLTNALRSTFISCRLAETNDIGLVSREAGNSPQIIQRNYLELTTAAQAAELFAITPCKADILPLFAWANTAS